MHFLNHKLPTYADKCDCSTLVVRKTADGCLLCSGSAVVGRRGTRGKGEGLMLFFACSDDATDIAVRACVWVRKKV